MKKSEDGEELNKIHLLVTAALYKRHVFCNQDECLGLVREYESWGRDLHLYWTKFSFSTSSVQELTQMKIRASVVRSPSSIPAGSHATNEYCP